MCIGAIDKREGIKIRDWEERKHIRNALGAVLCPWRSCQAGAPGSVLCSSASCLPCAHQQDKYVLFVCAKLQHSSPHQKWIIAPSVYTVWQLPVHQRIAKAPEVFRCKSVDEGWRCCRAVLRGLPGAGSRHRPLGSWELSGPGPRQQVLMRNAIYTFHIYLCCL